MLRSVFHLSFNFTIAAAPIALWMLLLSYIVITHQLSR
jgi:hypothetical protein